MKFTLAALSALLSTAAMAAPLEERQTSAVSMTVTTVPEWTIAKMLRVCNAADTSCVWTFNINTHAGSAPVTPCKFTVAASKEASETNSSGHVCGKYTVSTGWSGQFGPGNGFTTLAVVNNVAKQIIYPAYTDTQLDTNKVVTPNQSYAPQSLPS